MTRLSRRQALLAVSSGIASLAGCTGGDDRPTIEDRRNDRRIEDYDARRVRNEDGAVLFASGGELPTPTDDGGRMARTGRTVIVSEERLAELTFGDVPEAEELRSFVEATEFDASSVYLHSMPLEACYEVRIRSVAVEWDDRDTEDIHPHADFCRTSLPADVTCSVGEIHTVGVAIRLPVAAADSSGSGRGMSRACGPSPRGEYFNASVTPRGEEE